MLRIAICDDEANEIDLITKFTIDLMVSLNLKYEILSFNNGFDLINSPISFDLIFLDIEMDMINGIDIAKSIRKFDKKTKIVFITNSTNYLRVGYTVSAERYFLKPLNKTEFDYEITNVLHDSIMDNKFICDDRLQNKIYISDIFSIELYNRKAIVNKSKDEIATSLTLKEWLALLHNYDFTQSHKSYIVNLKHVKEVKTDSIIMVNNSVIPLSRKYKAEFKSKFYMYIGEHF